MRSQNCEEQKPLMLTDGHGTRAAEISRKGHQFGINGRHGRSGHLGQDGVQRALVMSCGSIPSIQSIGSGRLDRGCNPLRPHGPS